MSLRTSESNKAIAKAWEKEKKLVSEGKGTRNWTREQQHDILTKGKAYDENGRAFQGQHMKSVVDYPDYQGNPDNIQFLTKEEHLEAHRGNWKNPTNWYYNPETKEFIDFGKGDIIPCPVIKLTDPIIQITTSTLDRGTNEEKTEVDSEHNDNVEECNSSTEADPEIERPSSVTNIAATSKKQKADSAPASKIKRNLHIIAGGLKKVGKYIYDHKEIIAAAVFAFGTNALAERIRRGNPSTDKESEENTLRSADSAVASDKTENTTKATSDLEQSDGTLDDSNCSEANGTPKSPHPRRGYMGHRWKKNENGELELSETWISETYVNKDKTDDEE